MIRICMPLRRTCQACITIKAQVFRSPTVIPSSTGGAIREQRLHWMTRAIIPKRRTLQEAWTLPGSRTTAPVRDEPHFLRVRLLHPTHAIKLLGIWKGRQGDTSDFVAG